MLSIKYEFILISQLESSSDLVEFTKNLSIEQKRFYLLHHFIKTYSKDINYSKINFAVLNILLNSSLSLIFPIRIDDESVKESVEIVIQLFLSIFRVLPYDLKCLLDSSRIYHEVMSPTEIKNSILESILQLQTVINILRSMTLPLINQTLRKSSDSQIRHIDEQFSHHDIYDLASYLELSSQTQQWFLFLADELCPFQNIISITIKNVIALISVLSYR